MTSKESLEKNVNHPLRYTKGKIECIDALESAVVGKSPDEAISVANVIKYLWRYEEKEPLRSLLSARWYLDRLIGKYKALATTTISDTTCQSVATDGAVGTGIGTDIPISVEWGDSPTLGSEVCGIPPGDDQHTAVGYGSIADSPSWLTSGRSG